MLNYPLKYRPKSLNEIIGHGRIILELKERSKNNNFSFATLFSGRTGTGKSSVARIIAKNILCSNKSTEGDSCNKCTVCNTIDNDKLL